MGYGYLQVINPILGLLINVLAQGFSFKLISRLGLLKSIVLGFFTGLLSVIIIDIYNLFDSFSAAKIDALSIISVNIIIYASLGFCFFSFVNLGETARRVRILREFDEAANGLSMQEILERYNAGDIMEMRLNRLIKNGQVLHKNGRYYIGGSLMLSMAKIIVLMKLVVLGKASEFD